MRSDRRVLLAGSGSELGEMMSMEGCERVNFMRGEATRVVSTYSPLFEGDVKVVKRGDFK